ncbi:MAG: sugar transferase [Candidatus Roizmanbacteria bacterium]|nr:sugar transferase [Candidatus Roizmanbacteria bacterium]
MVYRALERLFAFIFLILSLPLLGILYIVVRLDSPGPFLFLQLRVGKNKQLFWIYKIRTMVWNAEALKKRYIKKNEADGPVFKIKNDPRYTRVGKILSRIAIDELPQLMNIIEGSMAFVGPRPLPRSEANKIPSRYQTRFMVLPGMTSEWVVQGSHLLSFKKWMELDCQYAKKKSIIKDVLILLKTAYLVGKMVFNR